MIDKLTTKKQSKQVLSLLKKAAKIKDEIAEKRDQLRDVISDLEDIAESCDGFIEDFECGLDKISQYL
jgi:uncharacterized protein YoxC